MPKANTTPTNERTVLVTSLATLFGQIDLDDIGSIAENGTVTSAASMKLHEGYTEPNFGLDPAKPVASLSDAPQRISLFLQEDAPFTFTYGGVAYQCERAQISVNLFRVMPSNWVAPAPVVGTKSADKVKAMALTADQIRGALSRKGNVEAAK